MALYTGRLLMRGGNEADFDPDKMMPREWAVSTDKKIVRICVEQGICIRMATYDAFEEDMAKIENILKECQSIQEAVVRINTEVSQNADAVAEYTAQAKQYSDEAKRFRDEAFATTPDGYAEVVETVAKNTVKIDTVIEKADLGIKETEIGEEIHLTDSAEGKAVEFALYGKAKQQTTSGKNKLQNVNVEKTIKNGITFEKTEDGGLHIYGTRTVSEYVSYQLDFTGDTLYLKIPDDLKNVPLRYFLRDVAISGLSLFYGYFKEDKTTIQIGSTGSYVTFTNPDEAYYYRNWISVNVDTIDVTVYPMICLNTEDNTYEPYTGGIPSPNPDYPQEIEVAGASGSVEVKSVGKNLIPYPYYQTTLEKNGITYTDNGDGTVIANGTATADSKFYIVWRTQNLIIDTETEYILSNIGNMPNGVILLLDAHKNNGSTWVKSVVIANDEKEKQFSLSSEIDGFHLNISINKGITVNNITFKPMIRLATDTDNTWEPYKETLSTIPTPNGLAGIKVDSGGNYTDSNGQQWICDEVVKYADGSGEYIERIKHYSLAVADMNNIEDYPGWKSPYTGDLIEVIGSGVNRVYKYGIMLNIGTSVNFNTQGTNRTIFLSNMFYGMTQTEWKTNYPDLVVDIYIPRVTPITTPLTAEEIAEIEKLHTFYPITNISNDFDCGMSVTYYCDSKNYIGNQLAIMKQEQEEAMANMLLLMPTEVQATMIENDTNDLLKESEI